jgi:hypothetical protein
MNTNIPHRPLSLTLQFQTSCHPVASGAENTFTLKGFVFYTDGTSAGREEEFSREIYSEVHRLMEPIVGNLHELLAHTIKIVCATVER